MKMQQDIIDIREEAKQKEWEAEMMVREKELENSRRLLEKRRREEALWMEEEQQKEEWLELDRREKAGHKLKKVGQTPDDYAVQTAMRQVASKQRSIVNSERDSRQRVTQSLFKEDNGSANVPDVRGYRVQDWVSKHSQSKYSQAQEEDDLQMIANKIIEAKMRTQPEKRSIKEHKGRGWEWMIRKESWLQWV